MSSGCDIFTDSENRYEYLIEYRGDFLGEMKKIDYACGYIITKKLAIVSVLGDRIKELVSQVPSILFVNFRSIFVLQGTSVNQVSNISQIKSNPYLGLEGTGVLVGIVDTGIDYMNKEFTREDDTSRIESIWDQSINYVNPKDQAINMTISGNEVYIGKVFSNDEINKAIEVSKQGQNPYDIVPSKDEIGHGTQIASIIGARGYDEDVQGVANNCNFVIVKLRESASFSREIRENNIPYTPVYNNSEIVAGLEYLKNYALNNNKPIIILCAVGSSDHSHDGSDLFSRYINELSSLRGIVFVTSGGNEGAAGGHASDSINILGNTVTKSLNVSREMKFLPFRIWIRRPNKMALAVTSPSGQTTRFIQPKFNAEETFDFIYEDTNLKVIFWVPDNITGLQVIRLEFKNIKKGIWNFTLKGTYIVDGRFDIWLPPEITLPPDTRFIEPDPDQTITTAGGAKKAISVGYYNQKENSIVSESGRGFPLYGAVKPDIAAPGINILATSINGKKVEMSGATVGAAIVAGACALLVQWGIVNGNDPTMYSSKIISYLTAGALRSKDEKYPNRVLGFGKLDLVGVFNNIAGNLLGYKTRDNFIEYSVKSLFVRIPKEMMVNNYEQQI